MTETANKKGWQLSATAFRNLLQWFDQGVDSEGQTFLEMRSRLVAYFDRKSCHNADELADETMNRLARRLEEEGEIESETPAKYCYIVARFVFLESLRARAKQEALSPETPSGFVIDSHESETRERLLECLDLCTGKLDVQQRDLILSYYVGVEKVKIENRRRLAKSLGITMNALSIRACRIRDKLEECVNRCAKTK